MYFYLVSLGLPLWLSALATACPLDHHVTRDHQVEQNATLFQRNIEARASSDLFSMTDGDGGCTPKSSIISGWLDEANLLHDAVKTALTDYSSDLGLRMLWMMYMGVRFDANAALVNDRDNLENFQEIEARIAAVSQFLEGAGLPSAKTSSPPWVFCGSGAGTLKTYTDVAINENGEYIVEELDETTGLPTVYYSVGELFPTMAGAGANPFFMNGMNTYNFDYSGYSTICAKPNRYAVCADSITPIQHQDRDWGITFGSTDRNIMFCDLAFSPPNGGSHSYSSLSDLVQSANYPTSGDQTRRLDMIVPISGTMYHELIHLTDTKGVTSDPYYPLDEALNAAFICINEKEKCSDDIPFNPESYVYFAVATYVYLNPPDGTDSILYKYGLPVTKTEAYTEVGASV